MRLPANYIGGPIIFFTYFFDPLTFFPPGSFLQRIPSRRIVLSELLLGKSTLFAQGQKGCCLGMVLFGSAGKPSLLDLLLLPVVVDVLHIVVVFQRIE